jgi:Flp pilus assembly protein TadG
MKLRRRLHHEQNGQSATEFAIVLPVFCLLLFAVIQFGILFNNYLTLTDAVRAGARTAAVSRLEANPEDVAEARVRSAAGALNGADDPVMLKVDVSATAWEHGEDVTVEASYPYSINLLGFVAADGMLTSKTTERVE